MSDAREYDSFDPADPDGLQVEVYDHSPAPKDEALHEMIASGNNLWAAFKAAAAGDAEAER